MHISLEFLCLIAAAVAYYLWKRRDVQGGWLPFVGIALEFAKDPGACISRLYEKGDDTSVTVQLANSDIVFLKQEKDMKVFYNSPADDISFFEVLSMFGFDDTSLPIGITGPENDNAGIQSLMANVIPKFSGAAPIVDEESKHAMESFAGQTELDFAHLARNVFIQTTARMLFHENEDLGMRIGRNREVLELVSDFETTMVKYVRTVVFKGDVRNRMGAARTRVIEIIEGEIRAEQEKGGEVTSFVQHILDRGYSVSEASGEVFNYLFATIANTHNACALLLAFLQSNEELLGSLAKECRENVPGDGLISPELYESMPVLANSVRECQRLGAPALHFRIAKKDISLPSGLVIKKGGVMGVSPYTIHRNPAKYTDPLRFNPSRHAKGTKPFDFLTFGRGLHKCPGMKLADIEMGVLVARLLKTYQIKPTNKMPDLCWETNGVASPVPPAMVDLTSPVVA